MSREQALGSLTKMAGVKATDAYLAVKRGIQQPDDSLGSLVTAALKASGSSTARLHRENIRTPQQQLARGEGSQVVTTDDREVSGCREAIPVNLNHATPPTGGAGVKFRTQRGRTHSRLLGHHTEVDGYSNGYSTDQRGMHRALQEATLIKAIPGIVFDHRIVQPVNTMFSGTKSIQLGTSTHLPSQAQHDRYKKLYHGLLSHSPAETLPPPARPPYQVRGGDSTGLTPAAAAAAAAAVAAVMGDKRREPYSHQDLSSPACFPRPPLEASAPSEQPTVLHGSSTGDAPPRRASSSGRIANEPSQVGGTHNTKFTRLGARGSPLLRGCYGGADLVLDPTDPPLSPLLQAALVEENTMRESILEKARLGPPGTREKPEDKSTVLRDVEALAVATERVEEVRGQEGIPGLWAVPTAQAAAHLSHGGIPSRDTSAALIDRMNREVRSSGVVPLAYHMPGSAGLREDGLLCVVPFEPVDPAANDRRVKRAIMKAKRRVCQREAAKREVHEKKLEIEAQSEKAEVDVADKRRIAEEARVEALHRVVRQRMEVRREAEEEKRLQEEEKEKLRLFKAEVAAERRKSLKFWYIGKGNGFRIVNDLRKRRFAHERIQFEDKEADYYYMKWVEIEENINFDVFNGRVQLVNYVQGTKCVTNKMNLVRSLLGIKQRSPYIDISFHPRTYLMANPQDKADLSTSLQQGNDKDNRLLIIKPAGRNKGNGIYVAAGPQVKSLLERNEQDNGLPEDHVVQEYISRPLLLNGVKFDMRCYAAVVTTAPFTAVYWPRHGYVRTSMTPYSDDNYGDLSAHLTNVAIQRKLFHDFDKMAEDSVWSFDRLQSYLTKKKITGAQFVAENLKEQMRNIMYHCCCAVEHEVTPTMGQFQLLGFDLMLDEELRVHLIEVNRNPDLSTHTSVLREVIPPVIEELVCMATEVHARQANNQGVDLKSAFPMQNMTNALQLVPAPAKQSK